VTADLATNAPTPILGVDLGGTKIAALLVDADDRVIAQGTVPTDGRPLAEQVVDAARRVLDAAGAEYRPAAVGIGAPGQVDARSGVLRLAVNLSTAELPLAALVSDALGVPCFVDHDARAAAAWLQQQPGTGSSLAYLSVGTGISAAIIVDGQPLRGVSGLAGEIGHMLAVHDGPPCVCGLRGCLEAVAAGPAVARQAAEGIARGLPTGMTGRPDAEAVYRAAGAGDALALQITTSAGQHLARAIRGVVLAYGVDRVVIGGGLSRAGRTFLQPILDELQRERDASALIRQAIPTDLIELLPAGTEAGVWGAVAIARSGLHAVPPEASRQREVDDG
jgi:glucokinase